MAGNPALPIIRKNPMCRGWANISMNTAMLPKIILTPGEPAGIGPDLAVLLSQIDLPCRLTLLSCPKLIAARAKQLGVEVVILQGETLSDEALSGEILSGEVPPHQKGRLYVAPVDAALSAVRCGELNAHNAGFVYAAITAAAKACLAGHYDAMVTGPVHKGIINQAGIAFSGHTELIAAVTGAAQAVMVLAKGRLRVALATTHLPLSQVSAAITAEKISAVLTVLNHDLQQKFAIAQPRILVCGLNPHAGEGGHLGMEEIEIITPALERLRAAGLNLIGPLPADTAFTPDKLKNADAVLAMFHDQGLPVIKSLGFGEIVNITFGLPIIRTSVDHGTALDLAGTGKAQVRSLICAIEQAIKMATAEQNKGQTAGQGGV